MLTRDFKTWIRFCQGSGLGYAVILVTLLIFICDDLHGQTLQDIFTNRQTFFNATGLIDQNNSNATVENSEPLHGGKPGGHSLWMTWVAHTNGIVRFKTENSRFDTLLAAYQFTSPSGTNFSDLRVVARADDSEGFERESEIEFGVLAGERYEIALDGYRGAVGNLKFSWDFELLQVIPAQILSSPVDRAVNLGDTVSLSVTVTNATGGQFKWFFNGNSLGGASSSTTNLVINNFQASNVGRYKFRVNFGGGQQYFSIPTEVQVNSDGSSNTLAQPKFLDASMTPLLGTNGGGSSLRVLNLFNGGGGINPMNLGVVRGYNGSQIFNTTYATTDPLEPAHCNVPGGASYWLVYQPPTNGIITLDTIGSSYNTVMEIYTYNTTPTGYADLIKIDCNDNAFATNGASRVVVPVVRTRQYLIAVDGVNGARGTAWLNYQLATNQLPAAPLVTGTNPPILAPLGATVSMSAQVTGAPPLMFTWRKNGVVIPGVSNNPLVIANVTTNSTANYTFAVTNDIGGPAQSSIGLTVISQPMCSLNPAVGLPNALMLSFPTIIGRNYYVEDTTNLATPWTPWPNFFVGNGQPIQAYMLKSGNRFFRVRVE